MDESIVTLQVQFVLEAAFKDVVMHSNRLNVRINNFVNQWIYEFRLCRILVDIDCIPKGKRDKST